MYPVSHHTFFTHRVELRQHTESSTVILSQRVRMTWLLVLVIVSPLAVLAENICDLASCSCQDRVVHCQGNAEEEIVLSPSSLPPGLTSLTLSNLRSLHAKTNTFREQPQLLTLILDDISNIRLDSFIFSENEYGGFLRTFEMNNVTNLDLLEDTFRKGFEKQCEEFSLNGV